MIRSFAVSCLLLASSFQLNAQAPRASTSCTLDFLATLTWVRESHGYNAGPGVALIVKGGGGNYATWPEYCGFTQAYANRHCGQPIPRGGMQGAANAWFPLTGPDAWRTVFQRAAGQGSIDVIAVGQKAGFDYGRGIHHVAAVTELGRPVRAGRAPRSLWTLAGNEGSGTDAGVKRTLYPIGAIDGLSNWN